MNRLILIIIILFIVTGCYDRKELNNISILSATEIDKIDDNYIVKAQVVNPQPNDKSSVSQVPFIVYTGSGKSIQEAYRNIKLQSPRYLYPDHLQIMLVSEKLAKTDISQILDFYLRDPFVRTEFNVLVSRSEDVLSVVTPIDELSSESIFGSLKTNNKFLGVSNMVTLNELSVMKLNPNREIILPSIFLEDESEIEDKKENTDKTKVNSMYKLGGLSVFKNNKLIGYLTDRESISYNIVKNNANNTIIRYDCGNGQYISFEMVDNKSKFVIKDEKINIVGNISLIINELVCNVNLEDKDSFADLNKQVQEYINNSLFDDINGIRNKYNSDVFGFLDEIYKHDYNYYLKVKNNWYKGGYKSIPITVDIKVKIVGRGNVMGNINEKN